MFTTRFTVYISEVTSPFYTQNNNMSVDDTLSVNVIAKTKSAMFSTITTSLQRIVVLVATQSTDSDKSVTRILHI